METDRKEANIANISDFENCVGSILKSINVKGGSRIKDEIYLKFMVWFSIMNDDFKPYEFFKKVYVKDE